MQKKGFSILWVAVMTVLLSACVLNVETDKRSSGDKWYDSDVASLRRGQSSTEYVLGAFGEPGKRISSDQGGEIWRYTFRDKEETEVGLIFLFHVDVEDESSHELNIEFRDGVVQDYWTRNY